MPLPPKPKGQPEDLHEVERALSVLQGRHPEHERARREDEEKRARRAAALDTAARKETTKVRSRHLRLAAIGAPVVALFVFFGLLAKREMGRRANVEKADAPYVQYGFTTVDTSSASATGTLEANVDPGCILAISTERAPIKVTRAGVTKEGASPMLFCTCANERIGVASVVGSGGGLTLMRADAATLGGSRAMAFAPFKAGSVMRSDDACSDASLDAWMDAKRYPKAPTDGPWIATWPARAPLVASGFTLAASGTPTTPFVVLDVPKESCMLAVSSIPTDRLGLRLKGGTMAVSDAASSFARCAQADATVLVSREGKGEIDVMIAPAAAIGGMQGFHEVAHENAIALGASIVAAADRPWDAKQALVASQIPEGNVTTAAAPDVPFEAEPRVVTLSFETPNGLAPETPPDTYSYCEPPLGENTRESTCVFSASQKWRSGAGGDSVVGLARAKLPFWLYAMQTENDPKALKGMTQLFELARRLSRDHFAPTTLEALTELPAGVEVLGRRGEDAIVAVGVAPSEPFVYPLSDGPAWTLDDAPRIVPVRPLERVTLSALVKTLPPKAMRRTVVFRRQTK
jgi:hypothetical protein